MGGLERNDVKERKKRKDKGDEKEEKKHLGESIDQSETKRCSDWLAEEEESLGNCEVRMGEEGGWLDREGKSGGSTKGILWSRRGSSLCGKRRGCELHRRLQEKERRMEANGRAIGPARLMTRGIKQY